MLSEAVERLLVPLCLTVARGLLVLQFQTSTTSMCCRKHVLSPELHPSTSVLIVSRDQRLLGPSLLYPDAI